MSDFAVVTKQLKKQYGGLVAVSELNLTVRYGEIFGFLGPNGAGKSTTIKMLVGLLRPTSGDALVAGYPIQGENPDRKRLIGYQDENPFLYKHLTPYEFLRFCGGIYGVDNQELAARAKELLEYLEMDASGNELIDGLSHGMRQKVALAAALIHEPKVLFLDEPTNGLDPFSVRRVKDLLRERASKGSAVFLTTHILDMAERICDRVGILHRGQLIAEGTLDEIREQANSKDSSLEDAFLALTRETGSLRSDA